MNKVLLLLSFLCLGMITSNAQHRCAAHENLMHQLNTDPARQAEHERIEREVQNYIANNPNAIQNREVLTIPVVFHVIHNGDALNSGENIPTARLIAQLDQINLDFRAMNTDFGNTPAVFAGVATDMKVEFCLATVDPNGNPTSGITRDNLGQVDWTIATFDASAKPVTIWDSSRYMNFWTARFGGVNSTLLGYAQFPGGAANTDGVVHAFGSVGSMASPAPSPPYNLGRTATHEVGHYLGLYHIWGDETACDGTDLVDDTPNQGDSSGGCPAASQSSCGSLDMHMNYMDYTDDACMYMFTQGQKERVDAVLAGPRSTLVASSPALCGGFTPLPCTHFDQEKTYVYEGSNCGSRTISIPVNITYAPSSNETVSVSIASNESPVLSNYTLLTPTLTFPSGSTNSQNVMVSIIEDAATESTETLTLNLSTASSSISVSGTISHQIVISDDDLAPLASSGAAVTILNADFEGSDYGFTSTNAAGGANDEWAFLTSNPASTKFCVFNDSNSGTFAFTNDDDCNCTMDNVSLFSPILDLSNLTAASLSFEYALQDGLSVRISTNGGVSFSNLGTLTNTGVSMPTAATGDYELNWTSSTMNLTPYIGNSNVQLEFVYDDGGVWGYGAGIDDVVVSGTLASNPIQTAVNSGTGYSEEYLGPNETVHFYDDSRNIMCTIENLSAHDYGCTKVEVDRAGTGATGFANTSTNSFLHDKSFKVSPTTNNASGTYNITLYYTNAEVTGWEGATSESRTSTVMHKTNGTNNISDVTAGNPSSIPLDAATAIYATFGSNHTYTASFSTGFSGFGVGIADSPLPVELLSFTGEYLERKGNQLDWITVTEENTSHFDVERSTDGINFEFMGKVEAAGNSSERLTYDFLDTKPMNGVNYYRLRMVDSDQTFEYSNVISLKSIQGLDITMSPNPTKGDIFLSFNQEIRGTAQIQLIDVAGRILLNKEFTPNGAYEINLDDFAAGTYFIRITSGNLTFEDKILKF